MMWLIFFFSFLIFCVKDSLFFGSTLDFSCACLFMGSICFVSLFLILSFYLPSINYFKKTSFYSLFLILIFLVSISFFSVSPFLFLTMVEMTVWPMSILFLNFSKDSDKISSFTFMLFINLFGSIPFMIFCLSMWPVNFFFALGGSEGGATSFLCFFCFLVVLLSKIPVFLAHFWLSKAHVSASGAISMLLASLMIKMGTFGLFKFSFPFIGFGVIYTPYFISLALIGSLYVILFMVRSSDVKFLVACSSILHMSSIFPMTLFFSSVSLSGCLFMSVSHGLVSFFLFFLVTIVYESSLNRSWEFFSSLECASKLIPMVFFLFIFLNMGVPPFLNFYSEMIFCAFYLSYSLFSIFLFSVLVVVSVVFTMIFVSKLMFGKTGNLYSINFPDSVYFLSYSFFWFLLMVTFMV